MQDRSRERLLANLVDALDAFDEGDAAPLLAPRTAAQAERLVAHDPSDAEAVHVVANVYWHRHEASGRWADLTRAEQVLRAGVHTASDSSSRAELLIHLAEVLVFRFEQTRHDADLDEAISAAHLASAAPDLIDPGYIWGYLSRLLLLRYERRGSASDLEAGLDAARKSAHWTPTDDPEYAETRAALGRALLARGHALHDQRALDEAVAAFRAALTATADVAPRLADLALVLADSERDASGEDLDEAIGLLYAAVSATTDSDPRRCSDLANLAIALRRRFARHGRATDINACVDAARRALELADASVAPEIGIQLGEALGMRAERLGTVDDLAEAETALRDASTTSDPQLKTRASMALGTLLTQRAGNGDATLDEAVALLGTVVERTGATDPELPVRLSELAGALLTRYTRGGRLADLDRAVASLRRATVAPAQDRTEQAGFLGNLGAALATRYRHLGVSGDLDEAIELLSRSVDGLPADHPQRAGQRASLAWALVDRFRQAGSRPLLDRAVGTLRDAIAALPADSPERLRYRADLAATVGLRYERFGEPADADEAIAILSEDLAAHRDAESAGSLSNLAAIMLTRAVPTGNVAEVEAALGHAATAVALMPPDHPDHAGLLFNLGQAQAYRYSRFSHAAALPAGLEALRAAAAVTTAPVDLRVSSARAWGDLAWIGGDPAQALAGYTAAVQLLPLLAWRGQDRTGQERILARVAGLAADAAAAALAVGAVERAVELLDAGRGVLWAQLLDIRTDVTALRSAAPGLAAELEQIRAELDRRPGPPGDGYDLVFSPQTAEAAAERDRRVTLAHRWDQLVDEARRLEGFAGFLRTPSFDGLLPPPGTGPVVLVNVSRHRCDAVIVAAGGESQPVPLPDLHHKEAAGYSGAFIAAVRRLEASTSGDLEAEQTVRDALGWLWRTVAGPILDALGLTTPPKPPAALPRLWWCPTGPLTLLPIHAAGYHYPDETLDVPALVINRVISSYTPTLRMLQHVRSRPKPTARLNAVVVAVPDPPGLPHLDITEADVARVSRRLGPSGMQLFAGDATRSRVLAALAEHGAVHFACHGSQDLQAPSHGAIHLADGSLTVLDLARVDIRSAELAYLSACHTAAGGVALPDEAIHLAAALQAIGYRQVAATLWSVRVATATGAADHFYQLLANQGLQLERTGEAVHYATVRLWTEDPYAPSRWAPYVHYGP